MLKREFCLSLYPLTIRIRHCLAIFNSSFIRYELNTNRRSNIHIYPDDWKRLALPNIDTDENRLLSDLLSALADKMLYINQELQEKRTRFLRRLNENFEGIKITTALQSFDQLDFKGFVAELKKQKIKLTLVQQDEWEDYFNQYRQACQELSEQIKATDNEIDNKVFDLYGLTQEEREIVINS